MDHHRPHHHTHHRRDDDEEHYPPQEQPPPPHLYGGHEPPPPFYGRNEPPPPFHGGNEPPPPFYGRNEPPPPQVYHSSHQGPGPDSYPHPPPPTVPHYSPPPPAADDYPHHRPQTQPHFPENSDHHRKEEFPNRPTVKMCSKAEPNYSLTIRDGKVILARSDPSDLTQHWIKDEKLSTRVKDEEGYPSFSLINKATGQALKHSIGATHPVQLIQHNPNVVDESIMWTQSKDLGDGYHTVRMVNNIRLNIDAFNGDKNHGGVHDGTTIVLWEWKKGDNQRWKIVPY